MRCLGDQTDTFLLSRYVPSTSLSQQVVTQALALVAFQDKNALHFQHEQHKEIISLTLVKVSGANIHERRDLDESDVFASHSCNPGHPAPL